MSPPPPPPLALQSIPRQDTTTTRRPSEDVASTASSPLNFNSRTELLETQHVLVLDRLMRLEGSVFQVSGWVGGCACMHAGGAPRGMPQPHTIWSKRRCIQSVGGVFPGSSLPLFMCTGQGGSGR